MQGLTLLSGKKFQRPMQKRRAYGKQADEALKQSSLGQRRRMDGMAKLMARAGRGLMYKLPEQAKSHTDTDQESNSDDDNNDNERNEDRPFEPLCVWVSPYKQQEQGETEIVAKGLPSKMTTVVRQDEFGVEEKVTILQPAPIEAYSKQNVFVPPGLAKWLRPHQREGVKFMYECVMGLKDFQGNGCILADDMGLGKTLQSVSLIYTLIKTHITAKAEPTCKRVIIVCPCSLVKNWDNEFTKWLGKGTVRTLALAEADRKTVEKDIDTFVRTNMFPILIASYECIRAHVKRLLKNCSSGTSCCDLLVCDEAHRLKNSDNQTSRALNSIPVKRRVLLTGTPMQNDLQEFYAMVDFTNPGILGTPEDFRKNMLFPILRGREPDATSAQKAKMMDIQNEMSRTVNDFILRRVNTLNAQHLPPKLVQVVCCNLTSIQQNMYLHLVNSKDMQHVLDGKQVNCLSSIQMLMKLCNHPSLIVDEDRSAANASNNRRSTKTVKYNDDEKESTAAPGADGVSKYMPNIGGGGRNGQGPVHPELSGKMFVLYRLMKEMRKPGNGGDKIVIVSNYTQTLDLIGRMCRENSWGFCRLDGSITMKKRQKMVDEFNDPSSGLVAFLLSSKAGGCGLNLIGGNRLVLFDPDWNPAVDKQAAARCWRDGQKKRCFTYRFLATGTVEEKIFQRQLSKEGLQSVVDDKEQVNALSTKDLRNLFKLRVGTPSDTHDKLRCDRCEIIHDNAEMEASKVLPKKLAACAGLLAELEKQEDAKHFLSCLDPTEYACTKENYDKLVKQPIDFGTIHATLQKSPDQPSAYKSVSGFSKDVNRVFANVLKVWDASDEIAEAARRLQTWWTERWGNLVPVLMTMKADEDCKLDTGDSDCADESLNFNERGDNYQEQIGMPDEENMRHWSHHHSTDTVDDPIFRAAMRGCDAVSFVFGLEVTWSLIQQRQQEEEERQAMEALENCTQNLEEDASAASSTMAPPALEAGCSSQAPNFCEESDYDFELDNIPVEVADTDNGCQEESSKKKPAVDLRSQCKLMLNDNQDTGSAMVLEDATSPIAQSVSSKNEKLGKRCVFSDSSDEESDNAGPRSACCAEGGSPPKKTAGWQCAKCTLLNETTRKKCSACGTKKADASTPPSVKKEWCCSSCTFANPKSRKTCNACGSKKTESAEV
ncbi:hypothetical protein ACA910_022177 [Epithemia clementina (nom. ined.)]